jgi:hypothetical protein
MSKTQETEMSEERMVALEVQLNVFIDEAENLGGRPLNSDAMEQLIEIILPDTKGNNTALRQSVMLNAEELIDATGLDLTDTSPDESAYAKSAGLLTLPQRITLRYIYSKVLNKVDYAYLLRYEASTAEVVAETDVDEDETDEDETEALPVKAPRSDPNPDSYVMYAIQNPRDSVLYVQYESKFPGAKRSWSLPKHKFNSRKVQPLVVLEWSLLNDLGLAENQVNALMNNITETFTLSGKDTNHCYILGAASRGVSNVQKYETTNAHVVGVSWKLMGEHKLANLNSATCNFEKKATGKSRCGGSRGDGRRAPRRDDRRDTRRAPRRDDRRRY